MENSYLKIIYEDEDLLVIDKPAGLTVNRSETTKSSETLQDLVEKANKIDLGDPNTEFVQRSGTVHRLDKETSGIILVAKNGESFRRLQEEFANRTVKKSYIALSHGAIKPEEGTISVPVGRLPWNRKRFGVLAGGKPALTEYKVIDYYDNNKETLSLVHLFPKTGRTHQIRVHLKYINHPIFGDALYSGRKISRDDRKILPRVFLHASELSFLHPRSGKEISFINELPKELTQVLESFKLKKDN